MTDDSDPFDFTPVPITRHRHDGWTPERQRDFIAALAHRGGVAAAARAVGMTSQSANRLRRRVGAESFVRAWDAAVDEGRVRAFDEAKDIAMNGRLVPITRKGKLIGHRRCFDNRLLFAVACGEPASRYERAWAPRKG